MTSPLARNNWSGTVEYRIERIDHPETVDDVRRVVTGADRLRVLGTRHTFNELPDTTHAISLDRLRGVELIDDTTVRVGGGATFTDVANALKPHALALENLASLPHISVAGGVATATHGSGVDARNLAGMVRAVEIVTASGDIVELRRGDPDFDGAIVSVGALGVVTRLDLDTVPARDHRQTVLTGLVEDEIADALGQVMALGRSVSIFTRWDGEPARIWVKRRDDDIGDLPDRWPAATTPQHPLDGLDPVHCTEQLGVPGWWADRLPHFRMGFTPSNGDEVQSEFHVAQEHGSAAVEALRSIGPGIAPALHVSEIRATARDSLWLSPQYDRDTYAFHFTWIGDQTAAVAATRTVEQALAPFDPRPHWGKVFTIDPRASYPRLGDFLALRDRLDPNRVFVNPWVERVLGA